MLEISDIGRRLFPRIPVLLDQYRSAKVPGKPYELILMFAMFACQEQSMLEVTCEEKGAPAMRRSFVNCDAYSRILRITNDWSTFFDFMIRFV